jgi:hypothetical protein
MQWLHEIVFSPVWQTAQGKALQVGWVGMIGAGGGVGILGGGGGFSFFRGGSVTGGVEASFLAFFFGGSSPAGGSNGGR